MNQKSPTETARVIMSCTTVNCEICGAVRDFAKQEWTRQLDFLNKLNLEFNLRNDFMPKVEEEITELETALKKLRGEMK